MKTEIDQMLCKLESEIDGLKIASHQEVKNLIKTMQFKIKSLEAMLDHKDTAVGSLYIETKFLGAQINESVRLITQKHEQIQARLDMQLKLSTNK